MTDSTDPLVDALLRENASLREQQHAIGAVLRAVARAEGLQPVLDEIIDAARRLCHGEHAQLYLREGELLRIFSASDDDPRSYDYAQQHPHAVDRSTVVGRVALAGDVVQIPDVQADPDYIYEGQALQGYEALLGVPILHDEELIGVIAVGRDTAGAFADEHVTLVRTFADQAAIAIANARLLAAVERQRTELSRFLSPQIAALVSSPEGEQLLAGHRAYVTVMFCDLRGFTAFVETAAPEELFEVLRSYHRLIGELIAQYGGTLEHFAGDGVMVFFNDPIPVPDHEHQAIQAALALRERFEELARYWSKRGVDLGLGIGITVGYATLGRIGFEGRYDYGALGPVTNLASRLSSHASAGQILIAQRVYAAVEESVAVEPVGEMELKGFARPVPAYNVLELTEPPERSGAR